MLDCEYGSLFSWDLAILIYHFSDCSQVDTQNYRPAIILIESLLKELKRLDDKMILTEVHLLESRVNHATKNYSKAKVRGCTVLLAK